MLSGRNSASHIPTPEDAATMPNDNFGAFGEGGTSLTTMESLALKLPTPYVVPLCGGLAGAASGIVSCPLDVIKTKLQAQGGFSKRKDAYSMSGAAYRGVKGTAATIWREEGLRGMYRGLGTMMMGYIPTWAVYLTVYNKSQGYLNTKTDHKILANLYSSIAAGLCSTMTTNPIWVIKTRMMAQSNYRGASEYNRAPWHYANTFDAARKMYQAEGLRSFYSGLTPALAGIAHVAIQFPLYEFLKTRFIGLGVGPHESAEDRQSHFYGLSLAVFLSKITASTATYPHEVVRTRLQTQQRAPPQTSPGDLAYRGSHATGYSRPPGTASSDGMINTLRYRGTIQTCKTILAEEGWRGFYAGLGTNLIRAVPSAMTTILTFEYLKAAILTNQEQGAGKISRGAL